MILGVYGAGGLGKIIKEVAEMENKWSEIVFIDDTVLPGIYKNVNRMPLLDACQRYSKNEIEIIIAIGEPKLRKELYLRVSGMGFKFANVIHPTASVSKEATLGCGIFVNIGAVISADATVEDNVCVEEYSIIAHDSIIRSHSQISAHAVVAGHCEVGEETFIGISSSIKDGILVGNRSVVGIGSTVLKNIPDETTAMGNPARPMLKRTEKDILFK